MPMFERSSCAGSQVPIRLLAVTPEDSHYRGLQSAIAGTHWNLYRSRTIVEALSAVINHQVVVIATDRELADGTWMDLIECLRACRNAPRVIVFSPVADDRLWMDVLHGGGYDLLGTPFERPEVQRTIHRAWLSWEKRANGLRSVWFPVEEPQPNRVPNKGFIKSHAAGGLKR